MCKTSEQVLNQADIDKLKPQEMTSLRNLVTSDDQPSNTSRQDKGFFVIRGPKDGNESSEDPPKAK